MRRSTKNRLSKRIKEVKGIMQCNPSLDHATYEKLYKEWERLRKWLRFFKSLVIGLPFEEVASLGKNQCVPTAIQRITGKNGKDVQVALAALSIRIGDCGSRMAGRNGYTFPVYKEYLSRYYYVDVYPSKHKSLKEIYKEHGNCLIQFKAHLACIVDGRYCDSYKAYLTKTGCLKKIVRIIKIACFDS